MKNRRVRRCARYFSIQGLLALILLAAFFIVVFQSVCSASTIVLQWGSVSGATGYKVYYQATSSTQPFLGTGALQGPSPLDVSSQTSATISGLDPTLGYYFAVTAYSSSRVESPYSNIVYVPALSSKLTVTISGNGTGSVNSSPSGIACVSGSCSNQFDNGASVQLVAAPSSTSASLSYLESWTGCSSASGNNCTVNVNAAANITVSFVSKLPILISGGDYYSVLQTAYANAANNGNLLAQAVSLSGGLTMNTNNAITITGGYNADYSFANDYTTIQGALLLAKGSLVASNLIIQ